MQVSQPKSVNEVPADLVRARTEAEPLSKHPDRTCRLTHGICCPTSSRYIILVPISSSLALQLRRARPPGHKVALIMPASKPAPAYAVGTTAPQLCRARQNRTCTVRRQQRELPSVWQPPPHNPSAGTTPLPGCPCRGCQLARGHAAAVKQHREPDRCMEAAHRADGSSASATSLARLSTSTGKVR
jgi:hypothetical protein